MRRRAFTLTELVVAMMILTIMGAAMTLSTGSSKQTARMEAERIAVVISRLIEKADRMHGAFWVNVKDDRLEIRTGAEYSSAAREGDFKATAGCSYSRYGNPKMHMSYNVPSDNIKTASHQNFTMNNISVDINAEPQGKYNIEVKDSSSSLYYVLINGN